jgi:type IV pilus assembly protein PilW
MIMRRQRGFTMIELMVALVIGIFLLGALSIVAFDNKRAFVGQSGLAQLQDAERLATTIMTDVIQTAGYYPTTQGPQSNSPNNQLIATSIPVSMATGQAIAGQTGDSITVRYATNNQDGILLCNGSDNETGGATYFANTFTVVSNQLVCNLSTTGAAAISYPLVNNVQSLSIRYGVNSAGTGNNVDSYMSAATVNANGFWGNVVSVQITITFFNPLAQQTAAANVTGNNVAGQGLPANSTISFTRTVALMNKAGI